VLGNRLLDFVPPLEGVLHRAGSGEQGVGKIEVGGTRAGGSELGTASCVLEKKSLAGKPMRSSHGRMARGRACVTVPMRAKGCAARVRMADSCRAGRQEFCVSANCQRAKDTCVQYAITMMADAARSVKRVFFEPSGRTSRERGAGSGEHGGEEKGGA